MLDCERQKVKRLRELNRFWKSERMELKVEQLFVKFCVEVCVTFDPSFTIR